MKDKRMPFALSEDSFHAHFLLFFELEAMLSACERIAFYRKKHHVAKKRALAQTKRGF